MDDRRYCSMLASAEPLPGTADPVDVWVLLEYRPPWRAKAVVDNDLAVPVRIWFDALPARIAATGSKARPQLVRQPEHDAAMVRVLIGSADGLFEFSAPTYAGLTEVDVLDVLEHPDRYRAARCTEPRYFVCTNGQRDLCCARFGLPVYRALRERVGARVWQTTHLGGHRFAPNVLVLPQGAMYGRVAEETLDGLLEETEQDALHAPLLRGRSRLEPPAQAAEAHVLTAFGAGWMFDGLVPEDDDWRVEFRRGAERVRLRVERLTLPEPILKSCADPAPEEALSYVVTDCREG